MGDLLSALALPIATVALVVGIQWFRRRRVRRIVTAQRDGGWHGAAVRVRGSAAPWPRRFRSGTLRRLPDGGVAFLPYYRGAPLRLDGLTERGHSVVESNRVEVHVRFTDPAGSDVVVAVDEVLAPLVESLLTEPRDETSPSPAAAGPRLLSPGVLAALVACAVVVVVAGWGLFLSTPVTAQVVSRTDTGCQVTWTDPMDGSSQTDEVDCGSDVSVGDALTVYATASPARGHAMTDGFRLPFFGGLLVIAGLVVWFVLRRRRRLLSDLSELAPRPVVRPAPAVVDRVDFPVLASEDLTWDEMTHRLTDRAAAERWVTLGRPAHVRPVPRDGARLRWWRIRPLWVPAVLPTFGLAMSLFALVFFGSSTLTWLARSWELRDASVTREAVIASDSASHLLWFIPSDVPVTITSDHGPVDGLVAWAGDIPRGGTRIEVVTPPGDPSVARPTEHDGIATGIVLSAVATVLALIPVTIGVRRRLRPLRGVVAALRYGSTPVRYALLVTPDNSCLVGVTPSQDGREPVVPLLLFVASGQVVGGVPPAGGALLHGEVREGAWAVLDLGDHAVWPLTPLLRWESDEPVLDLVNAWHADDVGDEPG